MKSLFCSLSFLCILHLASYGQLVCGSSAPRVEGRTAACIGNEFMYLTDTFDAAWAVSSGGQMLTTTGPVRFIRWNVAGPQWVSVTCSGGFTKTLQVTVSNNTTTTPTPASINGNSSGCLNQSSTFSVPAHAPYTPVWEVRKEGFLVSNVNAVASGNQLTVTWPETGTYQIIGYYSDGNCVGGAKGMAVIVATVPTLNITRESGASCTYRYRANSAGTINTYHWSVTGGATLVNNGITADVTWPASGNYTVSVYGTDGCGNGPLATFDENVSAPPNLELIKDGTDAVFAGVSCVGQSNTYRIAGAPSGTFDWTISGGGTITPNGNSAVVTWTSTGSFTLAVSLAGACFSSIASGSLVQVIGNEPQIGPIVEPTGLCTNTSQAYYVDPVPGATKYVWTPAGTNFNSSLTSLQHYQFNSTGNYQITVNVNNAYCTASKSKSISISKISSAVPSPFDIIGPSTVCLNSMTSFFMGGPPQIGVWRAEDPAAVTFAPVSSGTNATFHALGTQTIYFSYNHNTTGCTSPSESKTVTVAPLPTPTITGVASVCQSAPGITYSTEGSMSNYTWTVSPGNTIDTWGSDTRTITVLWGSAGSQTVSVNYTSAAGCSAVTPTTKAVMVLASPAASVTPVGPTAACVGGSVPLQANTGSGLTYQWRRNNTDIPGSTASAYTAHVLNQFTTNSFSVFVTNGNGCSKLSNVVIVEPNSVSPGEILGSQVVCNTTDPVAFTENVYASGWNLTYQWQISNDNNTFTDVLGATAATYDVPAGLLQNTSYYKRKVTSTRNGSPCVQETNTLTVTVGIVGGGTVAGDQTICSGGDPAGFTQTSASTGSPLTYQWQSSLDNSTFTNISGQTATSYDVPVGLTETTYYKRRTHHQPSGCNVYSNTLTVTVNKVTAGSITGDQTMCNGMDPIAFAESSPSSSSGPSVFQWQSSFDNLSFSNIHGANGAVYDAPADPLQTTYFRRLKIGTVNGLECSALTNVVTVTVHVVTGGVIAGSQTICKEGDPVSFTQTTASTGNSLLYQWESALDNSTFSEVTGQTSPLYDVGTPLPQTTYYRRKTSSAANPCSALSNTVVITVNSVTPGTISGDQTICTGADPLVFSEASASGASGSYSYQWQNSTDNNTFTDIGGATGATFDSPPGQAVTTYFRRLIVGVENGLICSDMTNTLTVTVNAVTAGTISSDQNYCVVTDPLAFTEVTGGTGTALTYQWQTSADNNSFTNVSGQNAATYDVPSVLTQTTYYRRVATGTLNSVPCAAMSNSLTVVINPVGPGAIGGIESVVCNGGDPAIFTETTASQAPGVIEYEWQSVLVSGGTFAPIVGVGATEKFYDIPEGLINSTRYRRLMKSTVNNFTCSAMSNVWTININRVTAGTIAPSLTSVCN